MRILKNVKKEEKIMAKKLKKTLSVMLSLLLIFSLLLPIGVTALPASSELFEGGSDFDYAMVMSEPSLLGDVPTAALERSVLKNMKLIPGGVPFGVKFMTDGVLIVGFSDISGASKKQNPASAAGLKINDRIISVGGKRLSSAAQLTKIVSESQGRALSLVYARGEASYTTTLTPIYSQNEKCYKSGLYVKDNGAGIGTVTYIVPSTLAFGGLGHGICDAESGKPLPIQRGSVVDVTINGVLKGQSGVPGEVKGYFCSGKVGTLLQNTDCGVFGAFTNLPKNLPSAALSLCLKDELREGKAYIWCTLDEGAPQKYEIEISSINKNAVGGKCFSIKVTDERLIAKTGGIVQGMSGSPIIQNGKLAGAVTHVLINDPSAGYGIFIENMLANMQTQIMPKAA